MGCGCPVAGALVGWCVARGRGGRGASPGGVPSIIGRGVWCEAPSLHRPPVLWSGKPGFRDPCVPGAVGAGVGTQHRPHSVRPCGPALLAVGLAEGRQALSLPRLPAYWAGCWGPPPTCCGCECVDVGAKHCPSGLHALSGLRATGVVGGRPRGWRPATVVRGVWHQAPPLPLPPVLWGV